MSGRIVVPPLRTCEDCGREVEEGVEPLGLFRPVPGVRRGVVWDETKQKWVRRPRNAAANGRRWREYALCRLCRATALRNRSKNGTVMENGVKRALRTRERLAPKKGGRPRLLNDEELRSLYQVYSEQGLSMNELAKRLAATREKGTHSGYTQSILYGWRRLGLELRPKGVQIAMSRFGTDGTKSKPWKRRCRAIVKTNSRGTKGKRCSCWAARGSDFCWNHRGEA